jgi:hypothetical protein
MDREQIAKELVDYHVIAEDEILLALMYARKGGDHPEEPIKLLEVNRATVPAGVMPVYFGQTREYPPVVIIEVTEEEYRSVVDGSLPLPDGWDEAKVLHERAA